MVVGLGNPGARYERTRHNVGFEVADELARRAQGRFRRSWRAHAAWCGVEVGGEEFLLVKPQTYMNRSGTAVAQVLRRKGLGPADLVVVVDDADLGVGQLRVRSKGSAGGHKGLKSIVAALGTEEFVRVRVGIGGGGAGGDLVDHVLSGFSAEERAVMKAAVARAADAVIGIARDGVDKAMNSFN